MNVHPFSACRRLIAFAVFGILLIAAASNTRAQVTIYAKFLDGTGVWSGESTATGRTNWVELVNIGFGAENNATIGSATGGAGGGRTSFQEITLRKEVDRLSPQIFANLAGGSALNAGTDNADVIIDFVKPVNGLSPTFFRVELKMAFFTKTETAGVTGDDKQFENITMVCSAMRYTYWTIKANGTQGAAVIKSWSQVLNNSSFAVN